MRMKITIETWNHGWRYEIADKDDADEVVKAGYLPTYTDCAAECLRYVSQHDEAVCTCFDGTPYKPNLIQICDQCGRPPRK